ncbi:MAG: bifunctional phosphoribosylaminoimidazolecarboxamide formyltransferase/IMP cyclohydrolase [Deltaproteobacteria bacterium]|nr:bifunctional phosphoribosylaminoimidazolecarboxamide formyltransferase/IMP cyclohydrolase [Deltaproteobacteria bacterium]
MSISPLQVKRALVSVYDKTGVVPFCRSMADQGIEIVSSGGTARTLKDAGIPVIPVSDVTNFPEILDGRVKTLNPRIHGGILARKDLPKHMDQLAEHGIGAFDLVAVNLYPFVRTIEKPGTTLDEALEMIDIGGPAMVRAAAKNFPSVAVVVNPEHYEAVLDEITGEVGISFATRMALAREAFSHTCLYDSAVSRFLSGLDEDGKTMDSPGLPDTLVLGGSKVQDLRYGENPHQQAAFYSGPSSSEPLLVNARQLWGKELSYNNIVDTDATIQLVMEFQKPACAIIKHTNPCGIAVAENIREAYLNAMKTDPVSAFGGIVGFNREVDVDTAREVIDGFKEVVIAPGFTADALDVLKSKKNLRVLELPGLDRPVFDASIPFIRSAGGGFLVQNRDLVTMDENNLKVVTGRKPTGEEMASLRFAWIVAKHVKSNAIVYATDGQLVAAGAGQMSRVDSARIGVMKANLPIEGSVLASDAFFPFRDGIDAAAEAGVTAIIQPGGSVRDEEVIKAADERGLAMVFTGIRHFRH